MSDVLELYFMVDTGEREPVFVSDFKDLQWLLLDYPDAVADCYTKHHHMLLYEKKPLREFNRMPSLSEEQRAYRMELV